MSANDSTEKLPPQRSRAADGLPQTIGPYRLLERIGQGGMGEVYLAEQERPMRRRVALKLIKLGMDTREVVARFEQERQALAMMDHPNIAKVLDGGATPDGRPFFVMEYVPGVPITHYCDRQKLGLPERLDLFMLVCHAVQHAHTKAIIHRDLKPSNILVIASEPGAPATGPARRSAADNAARATVKIIDFGVAKATNQRLAEHTVFTEHGQLIGTPEYMSPEQAEMRQFDIDTRTDIYSLGVLLYELLTGTLPFDRRTLRSKGYAEIQRIIREIEPPKPSTRVEESSKLQDVESSKNESEPRPAIPAPRAPASGPSAESMTASPTKESLAGARGAEMRALSIVEVASCRRTEPKTLIRALRGDLDWIVMKCLEKDRTRRYETANGLAMELRRHLNHEPVMAGPPSVGYRVRKFVRRNRGGVIAGATIFLLLVAGAAGTTWQAVRATRAEREQSRLRQQAEDAQRATKQQAEIAQAVNDFLNNDLLAAVVPSTETGKGVDVKMRDVLEEASKRIDAAGRPGGRFADNPLIEASIRDTIGLTFNKLGIGARAEPHLARAVEIRRRILGSEHPDTLASMSHLAAACKRQGKYADAQRLHEQTLEIRRRILGPEHTDTLLSMNGLANAYEAQGNYGDARRLHEQTLEIRRRVLGPEHPDTLGSMNNLACTLDILGKYADSQPLYEQTLQIRRRVLGPEHPQTLQSMLGLANAYYGQGKYADAQRLHEQTLEIMRRVQGPEHPDTLGSMNNLANACLAQGKFADAQQLYERTLEVRRRVLGPEHPDTLMSMNFLASAYNAQGRYADAERLHEQTLEIRRRVLGPDHPGTLTSMYNLALVYYSQGRFADAERLQEQTLERRRRVLGADHPDTLISMNDLARIRRAAASQPSSANAARAP